MPPSPITPEALKEKLRWLSQDRALSGRNVTSFSLGRQQWAAYRQLCEAKLGTTLTDEALAGSLFEGKAVRLLPDVDDWIGPHVEDQGA